MLDRFICKHVLHVPKSEGGKQRNSYSPLLFNTCGGGKGSFYIPRKATDEVLDEISPEEIAMKQHYKIHECLNFKIKLMTIVSVIELIFHMISENDDKTFKEAMYSFLMVFSLIIIKLILKKNRWLEDNAVFL